MGIAEERRDDGGERNPERPLQREYLVCPVAAVELDDSRDDSQCDNRR